MLNFCWSDQITTRSRPFSMTKQNAEIKMAINKLLKQKRRQIFFRRTHVVVLHVIPDRIHYIESEFKSYEIHLNYLLNVQTCFSNFFTFHSFLILSLLTLKTAFSANPHLFVFHVWCFGDLISAQMFFGSFNSFKTLII